LTVKNSIYLLSKWIYDNISLGKANEHGNMTGTQLEITGGI